MLCQGQTDREGRLSLTGNRQEAFVTVETVREGFPVGVLVNRRENDSLSVGLPSVKV